MCRCDPPEFAGTDIIGHVHRIEGGCAVVRLELENDHPAMQDAIADGHDPDQAEFISYVPLTHVRTMDGEPWVV
jgi:hypothetical protein